MKNRKHAVGWSDISPAQLKELFAQIESGKITKEAIQIMLREKVIEIYKKLGGPKGAKMFLDGRTEIVKRPLNLQSFQVVGAYNRTFKELMEIANFDWISNGITEVTFHVKLSEEKLITIFLFRFERVIEAKEVVSEMKEEGYRPATIVELVSLAIGSPHLIERYAVIALGSNWNGYVPIWKTEGSDYYSVLDLTGECCHWHDSSFCFAAVRINN